MAILVAVIIVGWVAAALIGTQAYFLGEQRKPIHERNWRSNSFENLAQTFTGKETDYNSRIPAYAIDAISARNLPN